MFRIRTISFLLLLTVVHHSWTFLYHCGPTNNTFFKFLSHLLTMPCEQPQINNCCFIHDRCYDDCDTKQLECDNFFCSCLEDIQTNFFCSKIIQRLHCNISHLFGKLYKCISEKDS
uniref:Phospholipase A2 n=1 Tax=Onchocerca volvulus TaxID=6282 RepID=A0A2K6VTF0_ONCVO